MQVEAEQQLAKRKAESPDIFKLPPSKRTVQNPTDISADVESGTNRILPKEPRRYVIYQRKSTDDKAKQIRSVEDQRTECPELVYHYLKVAVREEDILE